MERPGLFGLGVAGTTVCVDVVESEEDEEEEEGVGEYERGDGDTGDG